MFAAIMLDPIYVAHGVDAEITLLGSTDPVTLRLVDKTSGVEIQESGEAVQTVRPVAYVRATELIEKGIDPDDLDGATLDMNSKSWRVESVQTKPVPWGGAASGEYQMILLEVPG